MQHKNTAILWFRGALRLDDNKALVESVLNYENVLPVFVFDSEEVDSLYLGECSKCWLHYSLCALSKVCERRGSKLIIRAGNLISELLSIVQESKAEAIFYSKTWSFRGMLYEKQVEQNLLALGLKVISFNDTLLRKPHLIFNSSGNPYQVFTPFLKKQYAGVEIEPPVKNVSGKIFCNFNLGSLCVNDLELLPKINWYQKIEETWRVGECSAKESWDSFKQKMLLCYDEKRDFPGISATSRMSPYLHFGEISPRRMWQELDEILMTWELSKLQRQSVQSYMRQLVWREFANYLIFHFPHIIKKPLRSAFEKFPWKFKKSYLEAWQRGNTGYPIVDAGMRELWQKGWMHNRVRMIVASFLVKDLLQSWQEGAKWFKDTLVDADEANNIFGWQWSAGCGADAAPYFRIFNPVLQGERFDKDGDYVRYYVPELSNLPACYVHKPWLCPTNILSKSGVSLGKNYPKPIVEHRSASLKALEAYGMIKK